MKEGEREGKGGSAEALCSAGADHEEEGKGSGC